MKASSFPRSSVLVLGPNSIQSLVPSTVVSQVESLLESHRLEDAYNLADQRRKKLEESINIDEDEVSQLQQSSCIRFKLHFRQKSYATYTNASASNVSQKHSSKTPESTCSMENWTRDF